MNTIQKSETIQKAFQKRFQEGSSKMAKRKYCGYTINAAGELEINPGEPEVASWIFERYLAGNSSGKSLPGWSGRAFSHPPAHPTGTRKRLINCPLTKSIPDGYCFKKTVSTGAVQIENNGCTDRFLYTETHEAVLSDEMFMELQRVQTSILSRRIYG